MDPNGHINNVAYLAWAMEVIPEHVYSNYQLTEVNLVERQARSLFMAVTQAGSSSCNMQDWDVACKSASRADNVSGRKSCMWHTHTVLSPHTHLGPAFLWVLQKTVQEASWVELCTDMTFCVQPSLDVAT